VRQMDDRQVANVIRDLLKQPGRGGVFRYVNGDGATVKVRRRHINQYIREIMGESFSAKDFRTWAGTLVCACALARAGSEVVDKKRGRKRQIVAAIKETAEVLGNTPAVCRSSYICPEILDSFENGRIIDQYFNTLEDFISYRGRKLHAAERSLLEFMKRTARN
jgi:DNA topoisomerase I